MTIGSARFASTANWIAAARARETERPDRLFSDRYADALAGESGRTILERSERTTGAENPFIPVRTRYFDDLIAAASAGIRSIVLLGAGLDTRAFRLHLAPDIHLYEVDRPEIFAYKEPILEAAGARPTCDRHLVPADLAKDWRGDLLKGGFDPGIATLWIAEGLFFYLSEQAVRSLLATARSLSAPGSALAADLFGTGLLESPQMHSYLEWLRSENLPPPFATDNAALLVEECGWRMKEITMVGEPRANYGRLAARMNAEAVHAPANNRAYFIEAVT